jgi:hypothetical protein
MSADMGHGIDIPTCIQGCLDGCQVSVHRKGLALLICRLCPVFSAFDRLYFQARHDLSEPVNLYREDDDALHREARYCRQNRARLGEPDGLLYRFIKAFRITEREASPTVNYPVRGFVKHGLELLVGPVARRMIVMTHLPLPQERSPRLPPEGEFCLRDTVHKTTNYFYSLSASPASFREPGMDNSPLWCSGYSVRGVTRSWHATHGQCKRDPRAWFWKD